MARPAEKARAMLNKWVALREKGNEPKFSRSNRRPHLASECEHLADAERFRGQILREITTNIAKIQNPALPEHEVRDLNDEINRKIREKWHWNRRIKQLGGVDYNAIEKQRQIEEGDTQRHQGYRYFGEAKNLPGVQEFLAKEEERILKKSTQLNLHKNLTPDYFGWRDEEDGVLLELEEVATQQSKPAQKKRRLNDKQGVDEYLNVPSQEEVSKILLEHKKKALMQKLGL